MKRQGVHGSIRQTKAKHQSMVIISNGHLLAFKSNRQCDVPNDITPTAWKNPELTQTTLFTSPRDSEGTRNTWVITATKITIMLINAMVDAFPNY